ncbi:MAG: hypothetical protein OXS30_05165 [Chloroflexota bacterium]|nr:hypothetical protein [Chloroflexota bacterium]
MTKMSTMPRMAIAAAIALIGIIALGASALAQPATPHLFYGGGLTAGDVVGIGDATGTADANGDWSIQSTSAVADAADESSFTLNGEAAAAVLTSMGESLTHVAVSAAMMDEGDDSMMDDGEDSMMEDGDDSMMDDSMEDDSMMDDGDDEMLATDLSNTGTGGLADNGGVSAGLIGLLIALGAVAITGLGLRRVRNRA